MVFLQIEGSIPEELSGTYFRNGPGMQVTEADVAYLFCSTIFGIDAWIGLQLSMVQSGCSHRFSSVSHLLSQLVICSTAAVNKLHNFQLPCKYLSCGSEHRMTGVACSYE